MVGGGSLRNVTRSAPVFASAPSAAKHSFGCCFRCDGKLSSGWISPATVSRLASIHRSKWKSRILRSPNAEPCITHPYQTGAGQHSPVQAPNRKLNM